MGLIGRIVWLANSKNVLSATFSSLLSIQSFLYFCFPGAAHTQLLIFGSGRPADALATPSEAHSLADFCGLDAGQALEGQDNVLSIITVHISYTLAFTSPRELDSWTRMLRSELGCGKRLLLLMCPNRMVWVFIVFGEYRMCCVRLLALFHLRM